MRTKTGKTGKTGQYTQINKQSDIKFCPNRMKFGAV